MRNPDYRLGLSIKFILLLVSNIILIKPPGLYKEVIWFLLLFILFCLDRELSTKSQVRFLACYLILELLLKFSKPLSSYFLVRLFAILIYLGLRVLPSLYVGSNIIRSVRVDEIYYYFDKLKINLSYAIPLIIFIRLFPIAKEEFKELIFQHRMKNRKFSLENLLDLEVSLIGNLTIMGDDLTKAALSKGMGYKDTRTISFSYPIVFLDYLILVIILLVSLLLVVV